jgi:hypothetical protein
MDENATRKAVDSGNLPEKFRNSVEGGGGRRFRLNQEMRIKVAEAENLCKQCRK